MYLPPLQAMHDSQTKCLGKVIVHPSAAVAPGVLLQAEAGSQILIAASVCIGMGTVLHAYGGTIEIQEGANLGAGVLIIGNGVVGSHACIGTSSTVIESSVLRQQIVPPGSLIGDRSRSAQSKPISTGASVTSPSQAPSDDPWNSAPASSSIHHSANQSAAYQYPPLNNANGGRTATVHGKDYVNNLLATLLPNRAQLGPSSDSD